MNEKIPAMLKEAPIGSNTACFCLIDQRTFECYWATVEAVARHKAEGRKMELFYFLAQGWLDRRSEQGEPSETARVVGKCRLQRVSRRSYDRAHALCRRFRDDLNYEHATACAIQESRRNARASQERRRRPCRCRCRLEVPLDRMFLVETIASIDAGSPCARFEALCRACLIATGIPP